MDLTPQYQIVPFKEKLVFPENPTAYPDSNYGNWLAEAGAFSAGKVRLESVNERILIGDATAPLTGTGLYMGDDGSRTGYYDFRVGNPSGNYMHWDASLATLTIVGNIQTATGTGQRIVISASANTLTFYDSANNSVIGFGTDLSTAIRVTMSATTTNGLIISGSAASQIAINIANSVATGNVRAIKIDIDSTTSSLPAIDVAFAGTGELFFGSVEGTGKGVAVSRSTGSGVAALLDAQDSTANNANLLNVYKSGNGASGSVAIIENDGRGITLDVRGNHTTSSNPVLKITSASDNASSPALLIDKNAEQYSVDIDQDCNTGGNAVGIRIAVDNAGAGVEYAFEFAGSEYLSSAVGGTQNRKIKVLIGGTAYYIPAYTA